MQGGGRRGILLVMRYAWTVAFSLWSLGCIGQPGRIVGDGVEVMDNERLGQLIRGLSARVEGENGYWSFEVRNRSLLVLTDEGADRMRIMTAVVEDSALTNEELAVLLAANFDRALDARYAVARGYLWSAFLHPLTTLTEAQFLDGVEQVVNLADNYGTSYSSSDLIFQGGRN